MSWKKLTIGLIIGTGLLIAGYFLLEATSQLYSRPGDFAGDSLQRHEKEIEKPVMLYGMMPISTSMG